MRFLSGNVRIGQAPVNFFAGLKDYYKVYAGFYLGILVLLAIWGLSLKTKLLSWWILALISILAFSLARAYLKSQRYNLVMNNVDIDGKHELLAKTKVLPLFWILVSNSIVVAVTFGLMGPWAKVRTARYFFNNTQLLVDGNVDDFVAHQEAESNALAEEIADVFDLDAAF